MDTNQQAILSHTRKIIRFGLAKLHNNQKRKRSLLISHNHPAINYYANNLHIDSVSLRLCESFLKKRAIYDAITKLFKGLEFNSTEKLPVLFTSIRSSASIERIKKNLELQIQGEIQISKSLSTAELLFTKKYQSHAKQKIETIIHLGSGGSALGPQLLCNALSYQQPQITKSYTVYFISNVDGHPLAHALSNSKPDTTLVIVNSKSFTTNETLQNLSILKKWKKSFHKEDFIAITANPELAKTNGFHIDSIFTYPTWLGGRYSIFSPVSFIFQSLFGKNAYLQLLEGAQASDEITKKKLLNKNPSLRSAMLDYLYHTLLKYQTRAIFIYETRLALLLPYIQQLEMESNSKSITTSLKKIKTSTAPIIWGGLGTDSQHSLFQTLFQGTHLFPSEFITIKKPEHSLTDNHLWLLAHARAQQVALRDGHNDLRPEKNCPGNKPSSHIQLESLNPFSLGALISYYELRTFLFGKLLQINSFDQMGVDFSKPIAKKIYESLK
ncbi:MAG: hypothetical protein QM538_01425 [Methylacidiphilales bacterium]|nr:hypothetical protein [Candidatus Methylacidiphilales bacterium]